MLLCVSLGVQRNKKFGVFVGNVLKDILYLSGNRFMYRKVYFIGFVAYMFLLVLSLLFYKERCVFLDASYLIFQLVRRGGFCIELYRFGDAFGQALPVLGYKLGLSLDGITRCYSAGFILYYLACYFVCGSVLKQYRFAIAILVINLLFAADTFYWPVS